MAAAALPLSASAQAPANTAGETAPALVLILPGSSTPFARAAAAAREGFLAAHTLAGAPMAIQIIETDETPASVKAAMQRAQARGARMVVGPLTRIAVNSLVEQGDLALPTLALNVPDRNLAMPESVLAFGLPIEDEATRMAHVVLRELDAGAAATYARRYAVVTGASMLARRAGAAFFTALRAAGKSVITLDYTQYDPAGLAGEIEKAQIAVTFLALDAAEAAQLRPRLPLEASLFGTSLLNLSEAGFSTFANDLQGVRFLDMPWLVEPQRPVVAGYPRPPQSYAAELQRLYALGIDAYRVASVWMQGRTRFEIDGVTGWLQVDRPRGAQVERTPALAVFREGRIEPTNLLRDVTR